MVGIRKLTENVASPNSRNIQNTVNVMLEEEFVNTRRHVVALKDLLDAGQFNRWSVHVYRQEAENLGTAPNIERS